MTTKMDKRVHGLVTQAVKRGQLVRPLVCSACGKEHKRIHGHHDDYSKPLDVRWLCWPCHAAHHAQHRAANPPRLPPSTYTGPLVSLAEIGARLKAEAKARAVQRRIDKISAQITHRNLLTGTNSICDK